MPWLLIATGAGLLWTGLVGINLIPPARAQTPESGDGSPAQDCRWGRTMTACLTGVLAGILVWPLQNGVVLMVAVTVGAFAPTVGRAYRQRQHQARIQAAMGEFLAQLANVAHTYRLPYQALTSVAGSLPPVIRAEYQHALQAQEANLPLPDALRHVAIRLGDDFYAHQLAELVQLSVHQGADFAAGLARLLHRYRSVEEIRAEERTATGGYVLFIRVFAVLSLAPVALWVLSGSPNLAYFLTGFPKVLLGWSVLTAAALVALPTLLSANEV